MFLSTTGSWLHFLLHRIDEQQTYLKSNKTSRLENSELDAVGATMVVQLIHFFVQNKQFQERLENCSSVCALQASTRKCGGGSLQQKNQAMERICCEELFGRST